MEDTPQGHAHEPAMKAFAAAIQRWAALMATLTNARPASPDYQRILESLRESFAAELEAWLRTAHPFTGPQFGFPTQPAAPAAAQAAALGPGTTGARMDDLVADWVRLQSQLGSHWNAIGRATSARFVARVGALAPDAGLTDPRKLFAVWIDCAEEAYAETAHSDGFARLVADLTHTALALQREAQRDAHERTRAADLPTRNEIDALQQRIEQLERRVQRSPETRSRKKARGKGKHRA